MKRVGFIGLGHMGAPMALNIQKSGYDLKVFDLNPAALKTLSDAGATTTASAIETANDVDVLITMLPSSLHVKQLYMGEGGLLENISGQPLIIDCSTIAPDAAKEVSEAAKRRGLEMLDAPVSGGVAGATAGTLTFIVGGEASALEKGRPFFESMGKSILHAGDHGAGQVAKICNNMLLAILMTGTAEALQLGVNNGLDPAVLSDIMNKSSGNNWCLEVYNPYPGVMENAPASNDYDGGFLVDLMNKDLGLAAEAMLSSKSSTPMGSLAKSLYALHAAKGHGGLDFSSIQKLFQA